MIVFQILITIFSLTNFIPNAGVPVHSASVMRSARSDPDFRHVHAVPREQTHSQLTVARDHPRLRSASEANLLQSAIRTNRRHSIAPIDPGYITHGARERERGSLDLFSVFIYIDVKPQVRLFKAQDFLCLSLNRFLIDAKILSSRRSYLPSVKKKNKKIVKFPKYHA